jgi:uncharacterized protein YdaU (DUF1376 family)
VTQLERRECACHQSSSPAKARGSMAEICFDTIFGMLEKRSPLLNFYRRFSGDYLIDTLILSWLEDCAYNRLLDYQYRTERSIERLTEALEITRARTPEQEEATRTVYERFFPNGINPRFQRELIYTKGKSCKAKVASALGVAARFRKPPDQPIGQPSGVSDGLPIPDTRRQKKR